MTAALPTPEPRGLTHLLGSYARPVVALLAVLVAYRTSLVTLLESMRLDTPLAHLALVPVLTLALAVHVRRRSDGPAIHDRQLDWIVGSVLCGLATAANVVLPGRLSTQYWIWRIDLLSLPIFVAGAVCLAFGVRTLWKYRLAVMFLFLAWPVPYAALLDRQLGRFTQFTIAALERSLEWIPVATKVIGSDSLFQVSHQGSPIRMSVASACSGANGLVGFLLVATAFVVVVDGSRFRKLLWLLTGAAVVWVLNVARIIIIFWSAQRWGEDVAIDGFHPYTGLVVFNVGVVLMVLVMRLFGLRFRATSPVEQAARSTRWFGESTFRQPTLMSLAMVGVMATAVGVFNADLRNYDRIATSFGAPRLSSFAESRETPDGWQLTDSAQYDWTKRFFGSSSTWRRYSYASLQDNSSELHSNAILIADVIETDDRAALDAYGVEACYSFHNYEVGGQQSVDLGSGLVGSMLTWTDPKSSLTYTTLFWHWPIATPSGTRYERVTLLLQDQTSNQFRSPALESDLSRQLQLDINDLLRGADSQVARDRQLETRRFMIGFAKQMVELRQPADTSDG